MCCMPKNAGITKILLGNVSQPLREKDVITLPVERTRSFHPLQNGAQFLVKIDDHFPTLYFGGTDEQPFLVQVANHLLTTFEKEGENAFYEALKPVRVKEYEQKFGLAALRQGDIFAYPSSEWKDLNPSNPTIKGGAEIHFGN